MPQIRIDDEVMTWLKGHAEPFDDTPNSVLRRVAGLDSVEPPKSVTPVSGLQHDPLTNAAHPTTASRPNAGRSPNTNSGRALNREWKVNAEDAKYHKDGTFFEHLTRFPGALFDPHGYILFRTEAEYETAVGLNHGQKLNVPRGITSLKGYKRMQ